MLEIETKLSIVFHPQIDGQIEYINWDIRIEDKELGLFYFLSHFYFYFHIFLILDLDKEVLYDVIYNSHIYYTITWYIKGHRRFQNK